jgi:hypothetical protein
MGEMMRAWRRIGTSAWGTSYYVNRNRQFRASPCNDTEQTRKLMCAYRWPPQISSFIGQLSRRGIEHQAEKWSNGKDLRKGSALLLIVLLPV